MFARVRVLLLDKEGLDTRELEIALETKGYDVDVCHDGLSAMEKLYSGEPYSLVLLNLVLARRSGFAVIAQIRKALNSNVPIIALSGLGSPRHQQYAAALGANVCLSRPCGFAWILDAVRQQLDCSRAFAYEGLDLDESGIDLPQAHYPDRSGLNGRLDQTSRWPHV